MERRAGQLVVIPSLDFDVRAIGPTITAGVGGLLFLGNSETPPDLASQLAAAVDHRDPAAVPLVMADVEGGGVQRLKGAVAPFAWPRQLAAEMSPDQIRGLAEKVGRQMRAAGVSVDLAPVVDLDDRPGPSATNPDGRRSFSVDPDATSGDAVAFMDGLRTAGVVAVLKHFPGLGGSVANTDVGPAATRPLTDLRQRGLRPFVAAIAAGAPAVMVSNATTPGLSSLPASLSPAVIHDLLRGELGFSGLVVTDSLSAGAVRQAGYDVPRAAVAAVEAGADMVLFGSTLTPADTAMLSPANVASTRATIVHALVAAVAAGELGIPRLDEAVSHVLATKGVAVCPP